jgi:hypothetical protein
LHRWFRIKSKKRELIKIRGDSLRTAPPYQEVHGTLHAIL